MVTFGQNSDSYAEPYRSNRYQNSYQELERYYACFMILSDGTFVSLNPLCNVLEPSAQVSTNSKPPVYSTFSTGRFRAYYFNDSNGKPVTSYKNNNRWRSWSS